VKFHPSLLAQYRDMVQFYPLDQGTRFCYELYMNALESDRTKRLVFDARQARVFDEVGPFTEERKTKVHAPFGHFYMEFTEPIRLKAQQPGYTDLLRAMLFTREFDHGTENEAENIQRKIPITKITFFFKSEDDKQFVDRTWSISPEGYPLVGVPPADVPAKLIKGDKDHVSAHAVDSDAMPLWARKPGTLINVHKLLHRTWWEDAIISYTDFCYWVFAYTMAKSVRIDEIPLTRQLRRAAEREGKVPNPWHVVRVEPKFHEPRPETVGGEGSAHSYRYDVIGHIRFGRHKRKDGSYAETVEWISDHQRGLANELYIPKTYKVDGGKEIAHKEMRRYLDSK
jgi:hypothetical protein